MVIEYKRIFIDTAPIIYLLEKNPTYYERALEFFQSCFKQKTERLTSPLKWRGSLSSRVLKNFITSLFFKTSLVIVPFLTALRNGGIEQFSEIDISSIVQFLMNL